MSRPPDPAIPGPATAGSARWTSDRLISIGDIRKLFKLGRTAAYELTHRPDFPEPVPDLLALLPVVGQRGRRIRRHSPPQTPRPVRTRRRQPAGDETADTPSGHAAAPYHREGPRRPRPQGSTMTAPTMPGQAEGRSVIDLEWGITVYPPRQQGEPWRAVWVEDGRRRFREAVTEEKLAAKLEKVTERLQADAPNMERPGADLIAYYLSPGRPAGPGAVVPQARAYPAPAVRAVRRPGHRRRDLPGHQDRAHAADRQRRAHPGGRQAGPADDSRPSSRQGSPGATWSARG